MHGLRDPKGKTDTPERFQQALRFLGLIDAVAEPDDLVIAGGALNLEPESATFSLLGKRGLVDLVTGRGFTETRTSFYGKPGRFADYMLINKPDQVIAFDVPATPEVSDHRPLMLAV